MRIISNTTAYDASVVSRVIRATYYLSRSPTESEHKKWFKNLGVAITYSSVRNGVRWEFLSEYVGEPYKSAPRITLVVRLPQVAVTPEDIATDVADQLAGLPKREPPRIAEFAAEMRGALFGGQNARPKNARVQTIETIGKRFAPVDRLPVVVERKRRPTKAQVQRQRYKRVLELEKKWLTRKKLVNTKLKKLRTKRRYYERQLEGANA